MYTNRDNTVCGPNTTHNLSILATPNHFIHRRPFSIRLVLCTYGYFSFSGGIFNKEFCINLTSTLWRLLPRRKS